MTDIDGPAVAPEALAPHYSRFRVAERLLLTGHSHQAWPDVAREGQLEAFDDAAAAVDDKWSRAMAKADEVRAGFRHLMAGPAGEVALAASTHELVVRVLSALVPDAVAPDVPGSRRHRLVTTDGEFHSLRRQLLRLAEVGVEVATVPAEPVDTLAERLAGAVDDRTAAVFVSAVLFETARVVPHLGDLAAACRAREVELVVDAYHALGAVPFPVDELGLASAWVVGGGYKYLQLGEGNAYLRAPDHGAGLRPVLTGWFAEFDARADGRGDAAGPARVGYGPGASRWAGATYDPTSHYRAARVFRFFADMGLTPAVLRRSYQRQLTVLAEAFDALDAPDALVTRDRATPLEAFGGFLTLRSPRAGELCAALATRGVATDSRGDVLRVGPAPYLTDTQLTEAMGRLGDALRHLR